MRLINVKTLDLEVFWGVPPEYAILSHTWLEDEDEPTVQDIEKGTKKETLGYLKVKACCEQAKRDGFNYVWIDTCCIDKTNSHELQGAINSMFKWYRESAACYAFLVDYPPELAPVEEVTQDEHKEMGREDAVENFAEESFMKSKWFTRGWTLQELIAPQKLEFFSKEWKNIGSKMDRCELIQRITRISPDVLGGKRDALQNSSVAQRMSWASGRSTTREEDIAYCLLGIFGVYMPLIYGEGSENAFLRLQEEIMKRSDDHSLFAWRDDQGCAGHGLLASSPKPFAESSSLIRIPYFEPRSPYTMTNCGIEIKLSLACTLDGKDHFVTLGCAEPRNNPAFTENGETEEQVEDMESESRLDDPKAPYQIGIYVAHKDGNRFVRTHLDQLVRIRSPHKDYQPPALHTLCIPQERFPSPPSPKKFNFHLHALRLLDKREKNPVFRFLNGLFLPLQRGKAFVSPTKAQTVEFKFAGSTAPGRQGTSFEFVLGLGGKVGVLFRPSKTYVGTRPITDQTKRLEFIAVIFGVTLDGSSYVDICGILRPEYDEIWDKWYSAPEHTGAGNTRENKTIVPVLKHLPPPLDVDIKTVKWIEDYVREFTTSSSERQVEKEIWDLMFSVKVDEQSSNADEDRVFDVNMSYRSI